MSFFDFFQVPNSFEIDQHELTQIYKEYQKVLHPDMNPAKQDTANEVSAYCSTAYFTLVGDITRA